MAFGLSKNMDKPTTRVISSIDHPIYVYLCGGGKPMAVDVDSLNPSGDISGSPRTMSVSTAPSILALLIFLSFPRNSIPKLKYTSLAMSDREEDLAYGHDHSKDRGSEGTDRGFVSDTFKFLKSKHQQSQHQSHTQPSYGYTEQPYSSGSQQYTPGQSGYVS